ncbi:MAG: hypothetical protein ABI151_09160 [Chitinophagaceae bacterium]
MKSISAILVTIFIASCGSPVPYEKAADAQEAGTEFIRASLDGDYNKAVFYLYRDSTNTNLRLLEKWKSDYNHRSEEDKVKYKDASIIALSITPENDSVQNFVYTNSFEPKDTTTIKVIRMQGEWLVDLQAIH